MPTNITNILLKISEIKFSIPALQLPTEITITHQEKRIKNFSNLLGVIFQDELESELWKLGFLENKVFLKITYVKRQWGHFKLVFWTLEWALNVKVGSIAPLESTFNTLTPLNLLSNSKNLLIPSIFHLILLFHFSYLIR